MIPPPPRLARRLVCDPVVVVLCVAVAAVSPLAALVVAPWALLRRSWAPVALVRFVAAFATREVLGVLTLTMLWVASGFGLLLRRVWMQNAHYRVMQWWIDGLFSVANRALGLHLRVVRPDLPPTPLIVLARHAGMGDSLLLVRTLLHARRRPRLVIQQALQWDPCVDIVGHRVPTVFVPVRRARRHKSIGAIAALTQHLRPDDAVVIFPEGGNFSRQRHRRAVESLHRQGSHDLARRAEQLVHLLPPRPAGTRALLDAAPAVPVLLAAHAGLEHLDSVGAVVRGMPLRRPVVLRWWLLGREDVPAPDGLVEWLFDRWAELDGWVISTLAAYPEAGAAATSHEDARRTAPGVPA